MAEESNKTTARRVLGSSSSNRTADAVAALPARRRAGYRFDRHCECLTSP
jgi:hypothetical protein